MNSFNTDKETQKLIQRYSKLRVEILTFNQSCFPRINTESMLPIAKDLNIESNLEAYVLSIFAQHKKTWHV
jgi:UTP--glucose-1-phosphate uridylyltransferase